MVKRSILNSEIVEDILGDIDAINEESRIEAEQISLAANFAEDNHLLVFQSIDDMSDSIYDMLEDCIPLGKAIKIISELNIYINASKEIQQKFLKRYGKTSNKYKDLMVIHDAVKEANLTQKNIWFLKKYSPDAFKSLLRLATSVSGDIIKNKAMVHMAMLRFYILALMDKFMEMEKVAHGSSLQLDEMQYLFLISTKIKEFEIYCSMNDDNTLDKLLTISMSANKKRSLKCKHYGIVEIASKAWAFGCELLHTQMLLLLMQSGFVGRDDRNIVNTKLKKAAPVNRIFGPGQKKIIDTCPCCKEKDCPIVNDLNLKKRFDLPVSGKIPNIL